MKRGCQALLAAYFATGLALAVVAEAILLNCVRQSARGVAALQIFVVKEKRNNINTSDIVGSPRRRLCRIVVIAHPNGHYGRIAS